MWQNKRSRFAIIVEVTGGWLVLRLTPLTTWLSVVHRRRDVRRTCYERMYNVYALLLRTSMLLYVVERHTAVQAARTW